MITTTQDGTIFLALNSFFLVIIQHIHDLVPMYCNASSKVSVCMHVYCTV